MGRLLRSAKFWTAVLTFVVDITLLLVGQFFPGALEFTKALIVPITSLGAVVIGGIAFEDFAAKMADK